MLSIFYMITLLAISTGTSLSAIEGVRRASRFAAASAMAAKRNRPRRMKGFVWDYIIDRHDRLNNSENLDRILTSDVWYDLVDETKDSKWKGRLAKYFRDKYAMYLGTIQIPLVIDCSDFGDR
jgi:hypothetical protein